MRGVLKGVMDESHSQRLSSECRHYTLKTHQEQFEPFVVIAWLNHDGPSLSFLRARSNHAAISYLQAGCYLQLTVWLAQSAIRPVPLYARVPATFVDSASASMADSNGTYIPEVLFRAFQQCRKEQPGLSRWLEDRLVRLADDAACGLGLTLAMPIWVSFSQFTRQRLRIITAEDCIAVQNHLLADEELRRNDPKLIVETDEIIAINQPEVARLVRTKTNETLSRYASSVDVDEVDYTYRVLLVEVLVLSYAVPPPYPERADASRVC